MKKVQTQNHRHKSIGNGSRTVGANASPRKKKRSITSAAKSSHRVSQNPRAGKRSGCTGCVRSTGKK